MWRRLLPAGGSEIAVHVVNETPSSFTVDVGREVGQANMAADILHSAVIAPQAEEYLHLLSAESPLPELTVESLPPELTEMWEEYSHLLPAIESIPLALTVLGQEPKEELEELLPAAESIPLA